MFSRFLTAAALAVFSGSLFCGSLAAQVTVSSSGTSYTTIQAGVDAAKDGDTVTVTTPSTISTYAGNITITGKKINLISTDSSIIDNTNVFPLGGNYNYPAIAITGAATSGTTVQGFRINHSGRQITTNGPQGAIYIYQSSPSILNNSFSADVCAAIDSVSGSPTITGNTITGTSSTNCPAFEGLGSAIVINGNDTNTKYSTLISGNLIYGNTASLVYSTDKGGGGAINVTASATPVTISDNVLRNNTSTGYGGAVYVATTPSLYFLNNLVYGNKGISGGLDVVVPGSSVGTPLGALINNTIGYNTGTTSTAGSDIYIGGNLAQYNFANNIIVGAVNGQTALNCGTTYSGQTITPMVLDYNDFVAAPGTSATPVGGACTNPGGANGNLAYQPAFTNVTSATIAAGTADFTLITSSPLIDMGNNSAFPVSLLDLPGNNRFVGSISSTVPLVDMGAYELQNPSTCKTCTPLATEQVSYLLLGTSSYTPTTGKSVTLNASFLSINGNTTQTGSVTFFEDGQMIGTAPITISAGAATASFPTAGLTAGLHSFYATYAGDTNFTPATSVYINLLVKSPTVVNTTTSLVAVSNPGAVGQTIVLTATVTAADGTVPVGTVYFIDGAVTLGNSTVNTSGKATYSSPFSAGSHSLIAAFVPTDTNSYSGSTGSATLTIVGATVTAVLTSNPVGIAAYGQPLTLTATITPTAPNSNSPGGGVTMYLNGNVIANAVPVTNGIATFQVAGYPAATDVFSCDYSGDGTFAPATCTPVTVTIANGIPSSSVLTVTPTSGATAGDTIHFAATVSPTQPVTGYPVPTGSVNFLDNNVVVGTANTVASTGTTASASFDLLNVAGGTHTFSCVYLGDKAYASSTCNSVASTVAAIPTTLTLTSSANPAQALAPFTVSALLVNAKGAPVAGQTVQLSQTGGGTLSATTNASGVAIFTVSAAVPSTSFQATLSANGSYSASTANLTVNIVPNATSGTLIAQPTTAYEGQTLSVVASILDTSASVTAAGSIALYDGQTLVNTLNLPASVVGQTLTNITFPVSTLTAGSHTLSAVYTPTVNFLTTTIGTVSVTINPSSFTLTATPSITIQTEHHGSITATVTSIGNFSGNVALSFTGSLPAVLTPTFTQNTVVLPANGSVSTSIRLETDAIPNFYALLPFALLPLALRKRHRKFILTASLALAAMIPLSGCSGHYPNHTPPGTYDLTLQATGTAPGAGRIVIQTVHVTLIVTP